MSENQNKYVHVWLSLDDSQWKEEFKGWDCSNIGIRIETLEVRVNGEKQHEDNYELDRITNVIRWLSPRKPDSILAIFGTTESLSSGRLTKNLEKKSKKFRVVSYALGALLTTLVAPTAVNVLTEVIIGPKTPIEPPIEINREPFPKPPAPPVSPSNPSTDARLNQDKAVKLVEEYAAAKSDIFGSSYKEELLTQFTHPDGLLYKDAARNVRELKKGQKHYVYESFEIKNFESFVNEKNSSTLVIKVDENSKLIHRDGLEDRGLSNPVVNKRIEYEFRKDGKVWKIYNSKEI